jgi:hypothetical protein
MRKKWVIIATTVFLGVVCGVILLNKKNHYSSELFFSEMTKYGEFYLVAHMGSTKMNPTILETVKDWFFNFSKNQKIKPCDYAYRRSGSEYFCLIIIYEKNSQIYEVKIKSNTKSPKDELDLQSAIAKEFPGLPCEIITPP